MYTHLTTNVSLFLHARAMVRVKRAYHTPSEVGMKSQKEADETLIHELF
jgi:hypothetical protein